ncbi:L-type lectin-domain containing receptor kinase S.6 [Mercurialis annua]|uniref:L-type lectin-domain containing receptor kinase S.6 n=1 Tax=Mercurialis annua TaxID=3986 RepID=UPI00215F412A|nr:L-type lectin-domain containing receptor kinase S.6 [Mercurialis annua]
MQFLNSSFFWVQIFVFFNISYYLLANPTLTSNNVTLYEDAHFRNNAISLTQEHGCSPPPPSSSSSPTTTFLFSDPSTYSGVGRAFYLYPIRFLDSTTSLPASFSCKFSFSIIKSPLCSFGDGLAFLITSNAQSFSLSNGYMGLPGPALNPQDSFIAVEFDTNYDPFLSDVSGDHIGIDVNTVASFASVDALSNGIDLRSEKQMFAWIEYMDNVKLIQIWVSYFPTRPLHPILEARVDLSENFKEFMHIGFTASNGQGSAVHLIDHWRFRTYWSSPSGNNVEATQEGDCFMCYFQDPNDDGNPIKLAARKNKMKEIALGLGGLAAFILSIALIMAIIFFFVIKKENGCGLRYKEGQFLRHKGGPTRFSIFEIKAATMGFHKNRIIGTGASAVVYKGSLPNTGTVAVKRFKNAEIECCRNPFITEFATIVGCLKHNNLVQLQGWCCEEGELVLVYEYLSNGSLAKFLHSNNSSSAYFLSWKQRMNVVVGVASALSYLHEECNRQIIHRDVKTCNIMLDEEFNAKLGDFGLAEIYEHNSLAREATIPAGTMGYLAPEYVYSGIPSVKTDVYSFGVVVLELGTGKMAVDDDGTVLGDWVWGFWEQGKLIEAGDSKLKGKFSKAEMQRMLLVGLCCVHPNHVERPTVKEAIKILKGEAPLPVLPSKKPKVGFQYILPEDSDPRFGGDHSPGTDDVSWMTPRSHFGFD